MRFGDVSKYTAALEKFISHAPANCAVLDVGCGPANLSKWIVQHVPQAQITGIDISENMLSIAKEEIPHGNFLLLDQEEILSLDQTFTHLILGFNLPYLQQDKLQIFLSHCAQLLTPHAHLFLATMVDNETKTELVTNSKGDSTYITTYDRNTIQDALSAHQFNMIHTSSFNIPNSAHEDWIVVACREYSNCSCA